jgi:hypothetical protein
MGNRKNDYALHFVNLLGQIQWILGFGYPSNLAQRPVHNNAAGYLNEHEVSYTFSDILFSKIIRFEMFF